MRRFGAALLVLVSLAVCARIAWAGEKVIYSFAGDNGATPRSGLVRDALGNLYGTTYVGGAYDFGTVFELSPVSGGNGWKETILYSFTGLSDGSNPCAGLVFDSAGNLYGTTFSGGAYGPGTVFELTPTSRGWIETVLYSFTGGDDGATPQASVVLDASGNLYGTASGGGNSDCYLFYGISGCGTVFELSSSSSGGWTETTLYAFSGNKYGGQPVAGLVMDSSGKLYGTAYDGGDTNSCDGGCGTVFRLSPSTGGVWQISLLLSLTSVSGAYPYASLVIDAEGSLYGTTSARGMLGPKCENGCGTLFRLSPNSSDKWHASVLHTFTGGNDGGEPYSGLVFDSAGNLYGATHGGGDIGCDLGCGVVFKLTQTSGDWKETVLHTFEGSTDGAGPFAGVVLDELGNIYGTAIGGGSGLPAARGAVYEVIP